MRDSVRNAKRIVVKVGSSSISGERSNQLGVIVAAIAQKMAAGTQMILVSSGAIASALGHFGLTERPKNDLVTEQAAAAVGQTLLMQRYQESLDRFQVVAAQVLLTAGDLEREATRENAKAAMNKLISLGFLPIVNENDTVATTEIRFGDNDRLAALVSQLIEADLLILLSDVDALYTKPPHEPGAQRIETVGADEDFSDIEIGEAGSAGVGTGGAETKLQAARFATEIGIPVILTSASNVAEVLKGENIGTWFEPKQN
jgi:glutamate 5-kinase